MKSRLEDVNDSYFELYEKVFSLEDSLENYQTRNEKLELQILENTEIVIEAEECGRSQKKNVEVADIGIETEEDELLGKLKLSPHDIIDSDFDSLMGIQEHSQNVKNRIHSIHVACGAREVFLKGLRARLKIAHGVFEQRLKGLKIPSEDENECYKTISPPEADRVFHSYRRCLQMLCNYMDEIFADLEEIDEWKRTMDPGNFYKEMQMEIEEETYAGIFVASPIVKKAEENAK